MRNILSRTLRPTAVAFAALVVAACGGGGSGGNADTSAKASAGSNIDASNYQSFSGPLARTVLDVGGGASVSEVLGGTSSAQAMTLTRHALLAVAAPRSRILSANRQAVHQDSVPCGYAGSIAVSWNDADNNSDLSAGDTFSFTATNCLAAAGDPAVNGSFAMTLQQIQLDSQNNLRSLQVSGSFTNLSIGSDSLNGGYQFSLALNADGSESLQMAFSNMTATHAGQSTAYTVTLNASTAASGASSFSLNGTVKVGTETYLLEQGQNFTVQAGADYPSSGTLRLEDAAGDALVLEARSGNVVDFKFYPAGASQPNQTQLSVPWSTFGG